MAGGRRGAIGSVPPVDPVAQHATNGGETVAAVVVTHDRVDQLRQCVDALLAEPIGHLVVVDNDSTDGTALYLAGITDRRLVVVTSPDNLGGAGGFELGLRRSVGMGCDWLLLLDDDARPSPGAIAEFRRRRFGDDVGGVAAAVYAASGEIAEINRPGLNPFTGLPGVVRAVVRGRRSFHVTDGAYHCAEVDVDCVSFVGLFVRTRLVAGDLGFPPGEFFIYADDQIYTYRIRQLGLRNVFVPAIRFVHDTVTYSTPGAVSPLWKAFYLSRNNMRFYREIAGRWYPLVVPFKVLAWFARVGRYRHKRRYVELVTLGVADGLRNRFDRPHPEVVRRSEAA